MKKQGQNKEVREQIHLKSRPKRGKIWILAIDAFASEDLQPTWGLVRPLSVQAGASVEAVYVLTPENMNWSGDFSGQWVDRYLPLARTKLTELLPGTEIAKTVLTYKESGEKAAVQALIRYAERRHAECLVLTSHTHSLLERLAVGSFAEQAILTSHVPVLIVNPSHKVPNQIRKILVPTDFSRGSTRSAMKTADFALSVGAEIILYHKSGDPLDPLIQQGVYSLGGGWVSLQNFTESEMGEKQKQMEHLEEAIRQKGVSVSSLFDSSPGGLVENIERTARDCGVDMISVLSHSSSLTASLLGSVARGLVRSAEQPVLIRR